MQKFLDVSFSSFLSYLPFSQWKYEKINTFEDEDDSLDDEIYYEFKYHDLEVLLNKNYIIKTIFIHGAKFDKLLIDLDLDFNFNQEEVRNKLGEPIISGAESTSQYLGDLGAYDRYDYDSYALHFEYYIKTKLLKMITFISIDRAP